MKRADKRPWKSAELMLLAAPLLALALWLGAVSARKYLARPGGFGHAAYTAAVAFSPDGKSLLSCGSSNNRIGTDEVALWDFDSRSLKRKLRRTGMIDAIAFSPAGAQIAFSTSASIEVWDKELSRKIFELKLPRAEAGASALAFSHDGSILAASSALRDPVYNVQIHLWSTRTGLALRVARGLASNAGTLVFSQDDSRIFAACNWETRSPSTIGGVQEFNCRSGKQLRAWPNPPGEMLGHAFDISPDGRTVASLSQAREASGSNRCMVLMDAKSGSVRWKRELSYHNGGCVAFSPDGQMVASNGYETVSLWDSADGGHIAQWSQRGGGGQLAFSPGGKYLVCPGRDIEVREVSQLQAD